MSARVLSVPVCCVLWLHPLGINTVVRPTSLSTVQCLLSKSILKQTHRICSSTTRLPYSLLLTNNGLFSEISRKNFSEISRTARKVLGMIPISNIPIPFIVCGCIYMCRCFCLCMVGSRLASSSTTSARAASQWHEQTPRAYNELISELSASSGLCSILCELYASELLASSELYGLLWLICQ